MARLHYNFIGGLVEDNPLASGATTLNSAGLAALPAIASPDIVPIVLDPDGLNGAPEIAWVTAHTAAATSATISRGQEGTTAREHPRDIPWVQSITDMGTWPTLITLSMDAGWVATDGAPTRATLSRQSLWDFDSSAGEIIGGKLVSIPDIWKSFHVDLWWTNRGAGSGDVAWRVQLDNLADTQDMYSWTASIAVPADNGVYAAPAQHVRKKSRLTSAGAVNRQSSETYAVIVWREASAAGDTLANDAAVLGIEFVRAS